MKSLNSGTSYKFRSRELFKEIMLNVLDIMFNDKTRCKIINITWSHCDKKNMWA